MKRKTKFKIMKVWLPFKGKIHNILFPNCHPLHIAEVDSIIKEFQDVDFAYENLREALKVDEIFKNDKTNICEIIFFIQEETLIIAKNNTGWKEAYVKHYLEGQIMEAKHMKELAKTTWTKEKDHKQLDEIIASLENCISQLS